MADEIYDRSGDFSFEEPQEDASDFEVVDRADLKVVRHKQHTELRRKIEDSLERRRLQDDLGIYDLGEIWDEKDD